MPPDEVRVKELLEVLARHAPRHAPGLQRRRRRVVVLSEVAHVLRGWRLIKKKEEGEILALHAPRLAFSVAG